ncbi:hypothetical protein TVAG_073790 [Trichomonas vaginalis G3]|uniref:Uncharacterized protein n=1 Tax=Trichomonas vaginalis (strain ATCC PRA-98 / G3) TaxID=412133 RepID=A2EEB5_TRIV3|nr:cyclic phosphodiesterase domain-containing protein [Trichomonas vaginalis G3]EAY09013.1 hypothetical protein TVAG_073790 [Trichomonas vaginalis G3]KAI5496278.1 cyclic phosphodiesterase domain-containing protein [Trichomonas vaginalis G3]|eukprot:XP_001321236.1 hypothetical protein [Trichomonas vaginalis G3]
MSIRHFPHKQGQWVTHVCLEIEIDESYLVVPEGFIPLFDSSKDQKLHVSLSPLFSLKYFQVKAFKKSCENFSKTINRQCFTFENGVFLDDSSNSSVFYALNIRNCDEMTNIKNKFDKLVDSYNPTFLEKFDDEIMHISIARSQGHFDSSKKAPQHRTILGICSKLNCTIGGEKTSFFLSS